MGGGCLCFCVRIPYILPLYLHTEYFSMQKYSEKFIYKKHSSMFYLDLIKVIITMPIKNPENQSIARL